MIPFWMVFLAGGESPKQVHASLESAKAEAARQARVLPGGAAFVLQAVASAEVPGIVWEYTPVLGAFPQGGIGKIQEER